MQVAMVEQDIEILVDRIPQFRGNRVDLRKLACGLAKAYFEQTNNADTLFPQDVVLGAIFLACTKLGPHFSPLEFARAANVDLVAWPNVAEDMREHLRPMLAVP